MHQRSQKRAKQVKIHKSLLAAIFTYKIIAELTFLETGPAGGPGRASVAWSESWRKDKSQQPGMGGW